MIKALAYCRVSTSDQAVNGVSLADQSERVRAYCGLKGFELVEIVTDEGVSAGKPLADRPAGVQVLAAIKAREIQAVVSVKLDRLFRNAVDCLCTVEQWDKTGVALHLIDMGGNSLDTSTAVGKMFLTMVAGFAEMERNLIRERTSAALQHKKRRGQRVGTLPFGFSVDADGKTLIAEPAEQETISAMIRLQSEGMSLRHIATQLNEQGYKTRCGGDWRHQYVRSVLQSA